MRGAWDCDDAPGWPASSITLWCDAERSDTATEFLETRVARGWSPKPLWKRALGARRYGR